MRLKGRYLFAGRGRDFQPKVPLTHLGEGQLGGQGDAFFGQQLLLVLGQHQLLAVPSPRSQQVGGCQVMLLLWKNKNCIGGRESGSLWEMKEASSNLRNYQSICCGLPTGTRAQESSTQPFDTAIPLPGIVL